MWFREGVSFFYLDKLGNYMKGKWTGCTEDSELADGYWVVARKRETAVEKFRELQSARRSEFPSWYASDEEIMKSAHPNFIQKGYNRKHFKEKVA